MAFISLVLFIGGIVGHLAILAYGVNVLYSTRFRCFWVTLLRHVGEFLVVAGPLGFLYVWGQQLWSDGSWLHLPIPVLLYLCACWVVGLILVPYQTGRRWLRREPGMLLSNHTRTYDVTQALGYRPYGRGKRWLMAHLPRNEMFQVDFVERTFELPQLPVCWHGLTILHLSDLHLCGTPELPFYERVIDQCMQEPVDIVAITGDILDSKRHYNWIVPVLSRLRWRLAAVAILGNHDYYLDVDRIREQVESAGIDMIGGRWKALLVPKLEFGNEGEPLILIGNEMPWLPPVPDLSDCPREGFRLSLSHSPDTMSWARRNKIDLMLAGHTHGGQVRLPVIGPILVPSRYSRRYAYGTFYEPPTLMHVSRGLAGTYPIRYGCRPEVTRIVLRASRSRPPQFHDDAAQLQKLVEL